MNRTRLPWANFNEAMTFALACQQVMALRMARIALGGTAAQRELTRMVSEKAAAAAEAEVAAAFGMAIGGPAQAARAAASVYRRAVRENRRRLRRG